jgi:hypothetical protein
MATVEQMIHNQENPSWNHLLHGGSNRLVPGAGWWIPQTAEADKNANGS